MKKVVLSVIAALALSTSAFAADMPVKAAKVAPAAPTPWFDIAVGGVVMSDYNFRGVSQSNRGPSGGAYFEPDFTTPIGTIYVGIAGWGIDWPSGAGYGFTSPSAEIDLYGGWRNTWGAFSIDLGFIYYYYPKESFNGFTGQSDFWEIYAKPSYAITPDLTVGLTGWYTPDLLHYSTTFSTLAGLGLGVSSKPDAFYGSVVGKYVLPWKAGDVGFFISGELGHWWINSTGFIGAGLTNPSYTYGNIGLGITYKAITVDLRYHGNSLGTTGCGAFLVTGVPNLSNNWCNDEFVASIKFDTTVNALK